jgi:hypothetical protein
MKHLCAICTDQPGDHFEPLGRNDCMVPVCRVCETVRPVESHGVERGFEPTGGLPRGDYKLPKGARRGDFQNIGTHGHTMAPIKLTDGNEDSHELANALAMVRIPGARLFRVARADDKGGWRTFEDCLAIAERQDWYGNSTYFSSDARWYVWQECK